MMLLNVKAHPFVVVDTLFSPFSFVSMVSECVKFYTLTTFIALVLPLWCASDGLILINRFQKEE